MPEKTQSDTFLFSVKIAIAEGLVPLDIAELEAGHICDAQQRSGHAVS